MSIEKRVASRYLEKQSVQKEANLELYVQHEYLRALNQHGKGKPMGRKQWWDSTTKIENWHDFKFKVITALLKGGYVKKVGDDMFIATGKKIKMASDSAGLEKQGFNKYNVPELVGQLMSVMEKNGLEDTVAELKRKGFTKIINKAWQNRER